jgi:hypothetical protein
MTALRKEILEYIDDIPENRLSALRPLLRLLSGGMNEDDEQLIIETDLSTEEISLINERMDAFHKDPSSAVPLKEIDLTIDK